MQNVVGLEKIDYQRLVCMNTTWLLGLERDFPRPWKFVFFAEGFQHASGERLLELMLLQAEGSKRLASTLPVVLGTWGPELALRMEGKVLNYLAIEGFLLEGVGKQLFWWSPLSLWLFMEANCEMEMLPLLTEVWLLPVCLFTGVCSLLSQLSLQFSNAFGQHRRTQSVNVTCVLSSLPHILLNCTDYALWSLF